MLYDYMYMTLHFRAILERTVQMRLPGYLELVLLFQRCPTQALLLSNSRAENQLLWPSIVTYVLSLTIERRGAYIPCLPDAVSSRCSGTSSIDNASGRVRDLLMCAITCPWLFRLEIVLTASGGGVPSCRRGRVPDICSCTLCGTSTRS